MASRLETTDKATWCPSDRRGGSVMAKKRKELKKAKRPIKKAKKLAKKQKTKVDDVDRADVLPPSPFSS
jgi:hypothetical protein